MSRRVFDGHFSKNACFHDRGSLRNPPPPQP